MEIFISRDEKCCPYSAGNIGELKCEINSNLSFFINDNLRLNDSKLESKEIYKRINLIYSFLLKTPYSNMDKKTFWHFYYDETSSEYVNYENSNVNVYFLMKDYPKTVLEKIDKILLNLFYLHPQIGSRCDDFLFHYRLLYLESDDPDEGVMMVNFLNELNYVDSGGRIKVKGWERLEAINTSINFKTVFIAMSFRQEAHYIMDAFKEVISETNYIPIVINEKEHNEYIMPEIFSEIKKCRFLIMDLSIPNYGAYYEAGYAYALGKEVIMCCAKSEFENKDNKPHFDILQKNMVIWDDIEDLKRKLKRRIQATIECTD